MVICHPHVSLQECIQKTQCNLNLGKQEYLHPRNLTNEYQKQWFKEMWIKNMASLSVSMWKFRQVRHAKAKLKSLGFFCLEGIAFPDYPPGNDHMGPTWWNGKSSTQKCRLVWGYVTVVPRRLRFSSCLGSSHPRSWHWWQPIVGYMSCNNDA